MKKLSAIVNEFLLKWIFVPAFCFIIIFFLYKLFTEIKNIKSNQLYYTADLSQHVEAYLLNCKNNLNHFAIHLENAKVKPSSIVKLAGPDSTFTSFYLLDSEYRAIISIPIKNIQQDFSGFINNSVPIKSFFLTAPYYSPFAQKIVVGMISPYHSNNFLMAELNLHALEKHIKEITPYIKHGSAFLTDSYGNIVAHSNMDLVKQQENIGDMAIFKKLKNTTPASDFSKHGLTLMLINGANIESGDWKIIIEQNAFKLFKPIIYSSLISILIVCSLFAVVIFQFNKRLNKWVVSPVTKFTQNIKALKEKPVTTKDLNTLASKSISFSELFHLQQEFSELHNNLKTREKDLLENQEKYKGVVEDSPILICSFLPSGEITFANRAYCQYFDKTQEELIGTKFIDLIPEYERPSVLENLKKLTSTNPIQTYEHHVIDANGNIRWQRWTDRAIFDKNLKIASYQSIGEDITERKNNQINLLQERERLAVTLRSIGDGVITTDTAGKVVLINKVAESLTGWTQVEAKNRPFHEVFKIITDDPNIISINPVEQVLITGAIIEIPGNVVLLSKNGKGKIISNSTAPIKDKNSKTIGVVIVFRDITEKIKMQETLQRTAKLDSLGVLAGGIAHDFNNLLGGIFGYIDLALHASDNELVSEFLNKSINTIERARNLTGQLLTFSKGGIPLKKVLPLFPFVQETAHFALSGSNAKCSFEIDKDLKLCNYDKNQIGQVIDNLIINASQAMPDGGNIEVKAENITATRKSHPSLEPGEYIKLSIKDSGHGIPNHMMSKIFDPFFTTKATGHGIGLATCFSIIEKHQGSIDVESIPEKGTTFFVYLPATSEPIYNDQEISSDIHCGTGTILIMDDEKIILEMTKDMLENFGYCGITAKNGQEALEYFHKNQDKLTAVICDLTIPGAMGGKEVIKEIRKVNQTIPVFVASGYSKDPIMDNPIEYGFTASIPKPFKITDLSALLNTYL